MSRRSRKPPLVPPVPQVAEESPERQRIREDLQALKTALHMQASLLHDLEKILDLEVEISLR